MDSDAAEQDQPAAVAARKRLLGRARNLIVGLWGAVTGVAPHVLHHVGPLAGTALVAGAAGRLLFGTIGLVVAVPFLVRLYRRFRTWMAPAIAVGVFALMFSLSTFVIGPLVTQERGVDAPVAPDATEPADHADHDQHN